MIEPLYRLRHGDRNYWWTGHFWSGDAGEAKSLEYVSAVREAAQMNRADPDLMAAVELVPQEQVRVVCVLQNAWSPVYAGGTWPRPSWLRALATSRSGQRLRLLIEASGIEPQQWWFDNTTPLVAEKANGWLPVDEQHLRSVLEKYPEVVVACGRQAADAVGPLWPGALLVIPHPAYRLITNNLLRTAGQRLGQGLVERCERIEAKQLPHGRIEFCRYRAAQQRKGLE